MRILAIDPGRSTGVAILENGKPPALIMCKIIRYSQFFAADVLRLIREHKPNRIIYEEWTVMGVDVDANTQWPCYVIGALEAIATEHEIPIKGYSASRWQRDFCANAEYLPQPEKLTKKTQRMANRIASEIPWPIVKLAEIPRVEWPHVLDAVGIGLYALSALQLEARAEAHMAQEVRG